MRRPAPARFFRHVSLFDNLLTLGEKLLALLRRDPRRPQRAARLALEGMEDRLVPDGRPLPNPILAVGAGLGAAPVVQEYNAQTGQLNFQQTVFDPAFRGGVRVATGDLTGDGFPDVVVAPGLGGGPHIRVLDGHTGQQIAGPLGSFWAFEPTFTGGVNVAVADVTG